MTDHDVVPFTTLVSDLHSFYSKDFSAFAGRVWFQALKQYDLTAISEAFSRHCVNPDSGQFMPKPADVVKMLGGTTQDSALVAWTKVDKAVRGVGTGRSVVFDDPLIHRVLHDIGGWVKLGSKEEKDWDFVRNEFVTRYRGYKMRSEVPEYAPVMVGTYEHENRKNGFPVDAPMLIGDAKVAALVLKRGTDAPQIGFTSAAVLQKAEPKRLGNNRKGA